MESANIVLSKTTRGCVQSARRWSMWRHPSSSKLLQKKKNSWSVTDSLQPTPRPPGPYIPENQRPLPPTIEVHGICMQQALCNETVEWFVDNTPGINCPSDTVCCVPPAPWMCNVPDEGEEFCPEPPGVSFWWFFFFWVKKFKNFYWQLVCECRSLHNRYTWRSKTCRSLFARQNNARRWRRHR